MTTHKLLDQVGLETLLDQLKAFFGLKKDLDEDAGRVEQIGQIRQQYLLEIDYEKELAFDIGQIVGGNSPYVGSAVVGQTYVA